MAKLDKDTNYFVSMTDMMVGILFVFIIMIAYFAFQIQQSEAVPKEMFDEVVQQRDEAQQEIVQLKEKIKELEALIEKLRINPLQRFIEQSSEIRDEIVASVVADLSARGIDAKSVKRGVVTISGKGLFASGRSDLESVPSALATVDIISNTVMSEIQCFLPDSSQSNSSICQDRKVLIDSIYIEGHTDNGRVLGVLPDGSRSNLELSSRRATTTYQRMVVKNPALTDVKNPMQEQALSVAAYGAQRPIQSNDTEGGREANRRIDIRFEMYTPDSLEELERLMGEVR